MTLIPTLLVCILSFYLGYLFFKFLDSVKTFVLEARLETKVIKVDKMIKEFNLVMGETEKIKADKFLKKDFEHLIEKTAEIGFLNGEIFGIENTLKKLKKKTFLKIEKQDEQKKEEK